MRRIPFRYIFPIASFAVAALLLLVPSWLAARDRDTSEDGVGWGEVDFVSPPLAAEIVGAMYLPATVAAAPVLLAGSHLADAYPIYGRQIANVGTVIFVLAGFLQWYCIGWLLEGQMGYRLAPTPFSKRKRAVNSIAIGIAASLAALGAFIAFQPGGMKMGLTSVLWASAIVIVLIRRRRAQSDPSPKTTQLSLR
ncbi:MAG TPA: hypothetical protein VN902_06115 [Candidatus Acidoferrales bacterium]|jgi:hypothetical protein|nr:hypothetical protein [Candidatus Acidoferrales bacterium]